MAGSQIGTAAYMSPEQTIGDDATPASDLFSMGVIASEMLLGENVFRGESLNQTLQNIRRLKIGKKAFPEGTPKQLVKLVMQLLEKKPSKRPLSAADVADELSRIMRAYPRDLTPYLSEWVTSAIKGEITAIEPKTYPNKCGKMTIVITALASAIATTVAFLLLTTL